MESRGTCCVVRSYRASDAASLATNADNRKIWLKAGYRCEGLLESSAVKDGQLLDQYMYARVAESPVARVAAPPLDGDAT